MPNTEQSTLAFPVGSHVAGDWLTAGSAGQSNINPSDTDDIVCRFGRASVSTVTDAVQAARDAFPAWSRSSPQLRADILNRIANEIEARRDELGALLAREEGKTLPESVGEVQRAGQIFRFFAGEPLRAGGERLPSPREQVLVDIIREPVGVVGIITPWNFPIAIPAWKIAPALAYGNCVVFKPAELVPASACALMDIAHRAGLPAGVLNLVLGSGSVVGEAICAHPDVDALSFTGSQAVGAQVAQHGVARLARVQLEMGGKNPLVIAADADLDVAAEVAVQGAFYSTGQRCTASSRLIVVDEAYDGFVEALVARMRRLTVGHALRPGTDIGPVVDGRQLAGNLEFLQRAGGSAGVEVIAGARVERDEPGFYMEPALVLGTGNDDEINREEVFGPVATVLRAADYEQALHLANDTRFGLCAGICTRSLRLAEHFKAHADAGMVMVNLPTAGVDYHVPFGGRKGSSYGPREQGTYAREFYTRTKTAYVGLR